MKYKIGDTVYYLDKGEICSLTINVIHLYKDSVFLIQSDGLREYMVNELNTYKTFADAKAQLLKQAKDEYDKRIKEINGL